MQTLQFKPQTICAQADIVLSASVALCYDSPRLNSKTLLSGNHNQPNHLHARAISKSRTAQSTMGCCCVYCLDLFKNVATGIKRADAFRSSRMFRGLTFFAIDRYCSACTLSLNDQEQAFNCESLKSDMRHCNMHVLQHHVGGPEVSKQSVPEHTNRHDKYSLTAGLLSHLSGKSRLLDVCFPLLAKGGQLYLLSWQSLGIAQALRASWQSH